MEIVDPLKSRGYQCNRTSVSDRVPADREELVAAVLAATNVI